VIDCYFFTIIT